MKKKKMVCVLETIYCILLLGYFIFIYLKKTVHTLINGQNYQFVTFKIESEIFSDFHFFFRAARVAL